MSSISRFYTKEGTPVLESKDCRDSDTPYPCPHIFHITRFHVYMKVNIPD